MRVAEVQGGQVVVKQREKPTRWITIEGGKRIPITPRKERAARFKEREAEWEVGEPETGIEQMGLQAAPSPAFQRLSSMIYEEHPLGDQEPEQPTVFSYNTFAELDTAGSWYGARQRPSGWYMSKKDKGIIGNHEIHLSSPECLMDRFPGRSLEEYQQYWTHVAAHEVMHSTGFGHNLKAASASWGEALNEIAARRFLDENFPDMGELVRKRGSYQSEINGLIIILSAAANSNIPQASKLLGEVLAAAEKSGYDLAAKIGEVYRNWSAEHQDFYPDGPLAQRGVKAWDYVSDTDCGFDILENPDN